MSRYLEMETLSCFIVNPTRGCQFEIFCVDLQASTCSRLQMALIGYEYATKAEFKRLRNMACRPTIMLGDLVVAKTRKHQGRSSEVFYKRNQRRSPFAKLALNPRRAISQRDCCSRRHCQVQKATDGCCLVKASMWIDEPGTFWTLQDAMGREMLAIFTE